MEPEGAKRGSDSGGNKRKHSGSEEVARTNGGEHDPAVGSPRVVVEPEAESDIPVASTDVTQQKNNTNDNDGQRTPTTGITAAQMQAALDEIMDPTYVAAVKISKGDIRRAEDGLRDVIKTSF